MGSVRVTRGDGLVIVQDCVVPASRSVSAGSRSVTYDLDIRELAIGRAENLRRVIDEGIPQLIRVLPRASVVRFRSRGPGAFDHRMDVIAAYVGSEIRFEARARSAFSWQLPEETLALRTGDSCERASLMAAMARAAGISSYCLRVAIGTLRLAGPEPGDHPHVWLEYRTERGRWTIVEPLDPLGEMNAAADKPVHPPKGEAIAYVPQFFFNEAHVWTLEPLEDAPSLAETLARRVRTRVITPAFLGAMHRDRVTEALAFLRGTSDAWVIDPIGRYYKAAGDTPNVARLLARFRQDCDLDAFARAMHGIDDLARVRTAFQEGWAALATTKVIAPCLTS